MILRLYDQYGHEKAEISANEGSTQTKEIQSDNVLSLGFTLYSFVSIDVNDYVDFEGERYWAVEKYHPSEKSSVEWEYSVQLYGIESLIKRFLVLHEGDAVFALTARPIEHVRLIAQCINDGMGGTRSFKVGQVEGTDNVVMSYEGKYCDEALKELAEAVGVEWWMEGETVNLCRCEHGETVTLGYGEGLTNLDHDKADNAKFYTRLYPIGSSRNIDAERYGASRLQLPGGVKWMDVEGLVGKYGVVHHYEREAFSGIYPRRVGKVSDVRQKEVKDTDGRPYTIYYFKDEELDFDPNEHEIGDLVKHVSFQEGSQLAGLGTGDEHYFEVNYDSDTKEFELITIWPYDDDTALPGGELVPAIGDEYILWNIRMPDSYYALAEEEFRQAVVEYNRKHTKDVSRYKAPTDHVWIENTGTELSVGRRVRLLSREYFPELGYRESRITKISRKVNLPSQMDLEISDALSTGTLDHIDDAINDVKNYTSGLMPNVPDLIRSWETTQPADNNLFSARRVVKQFLDKTTLERQEVQGPVAFRQDAEVEGTLAVGGKVEADVVRAGGSGRIQLGDDTDVTGELVAHEKIFSEKELVLGDGTAASEGAERKLLETVGSLDSMVNGRGTFVTSKDRLQTTSLEVRGSLTVMDLIINQLHAMAGEYYFSDVGSIERVAVIDRQRNAYRLYLKKESETSVITLWEGDILWSVANNLLEHRPTDSAYFVHPSWMLVNAIDQERFFVDVSLYDDENLGIVVGRTNWAPEAGFNLARRGNARARLDTSFSERARVWHISNTEGMMAFLDYLYSPVVGDESYQTTVGRLPDIEVLRNWFEARNLGSPGDHVGVYTRFLFAENFVHVDWMGRVVSQLNYRGEWSMETARSERDCYKVEKTLQSVEDGKRETAYLTDTVTWLGAMWGCNRTGTVAEPTWYSADWIFTGGNNEWDIELHRGEGATPRLSQAVMEMELYFRILFNGYDVTDRVLAQDYHSVSWTRTTDDADLDRTWNEAGIRVCRQDETGTRLLLRQDEAGGRCDFGNHFRTFRRATFKVEVVIPMAAGESKTVSRTFNFL